MGFFMLPEKPEQSLTADDFAALRSLWSSIPENRWMNTSASSLRRVRSRPRSTGTGPMLSCWRSAAKAEVRPGAASNAAPLGHQDIAVGVLQWRRRQSYMKGPYRLVELNAGHWLVQEEPERVTTRY